MDPEIDENEEPLTKEWVENKLVELQKSDVFLKLRLSVQHSVYFYYEIEDEEEIGSTPSKYWVQPDAGTSAVLDIYRELLIESDPVISKDFDKSDEEIKRKVIKALEPNSNTRRLLLAYWGSSEDEKWQQTEQGINTIQSHIKDGEYFPKQETLSGVFKRLGLDLDEVKA